MTAQEKIASLCGMIADALRPVITGDYWLLEVPYYSNVGDSLVWQGEMDFLRGIPFKCKGMHSMWTFSFPRLEEDDVILLQGGGNFGDVWPGPNDFRMEVVKRYPRNRIVLFPQSVEFEKDSALQDTVECFNTHKKLTVCVRDRHSYELLKGRLTCDLLLLPDMAFCMDLSAWNVRRQPEVDRLFLVRDDKEFKPNDRLLEANRELDIVSDWPTMLPDDRIAWACGQCFLFSRFFKGPVDFLARSIYRPHIIRAGISFESRAAKIFSTRLHGAILGLLLGKKVVLFDNSYGKNRRFYETWLSDCEDVELR